MKNILENKWVVGIGTAVIAGIILYLIFGSNTSNNIDDRDIVDNKGATNPTTNINVNPVVEDNIVHSSLINVYLEIIVDEDLREFNGRIASRIEEVILETESGKLIKFFSNPGSTMMIRSGNKYKFSFTGLINVAQINELALDELKSVKNIYINLGRFAEITEDPYSRLGLIKLTFYVNNEMIEDYQSKPNSIFNSTSKIRITI